MKIYNHLPKKKKLLLENYFIFSSNQMCFLFWKHQQKKKNKFKFLKTKFLKQKLKKHLSNILSCQFVYFTFFPFDC